MAGWGEPFPRWSPFVGSRRVPPPAAVIPVLLGGPALVAMFDLMPLAWAGILPEAGSSSGWWMALARLRSGPAMPWGPIVPALARALAYYRRRRPA
ncbi:hypothetical protein LN042_06820 [Kitasatospora sp. RB6PN24]|uniref:hypothetical protein n=1 Tax=Kitasatospora humi TaxID=2893891 RepID=UPI001E5F8A7B|nr:hypothetical protein [Kitasatospora humi]MCC9306818.1 hypothetical protein [Kitasatospora humi]